MFKGTFKSGIRKVSIFLLCEIFSLHMRCRFVSHLPILNLSWKHKHFFRSLNSESNSINMSRDKVFKKLEIIHKSFLKRSYALLAQYSNYIVLILYG